VNGLLLLGTVLGEMAWTPILIFFVRQWWRRKNPISMAIALGLSFIMVLGLAPLWIFDQRVDHEIAIMANMVLNFVIISYFYVAFYLSTRRFPEQRRSPS
jgi:hypothetical protein